MIDLSPVTSRDAQEAISRAHSNYSLLLLPLSSGAFAIFDRAFGLREILSAADLSPERIRELSKEFEEILRRQSPLPEGGQKISATLEDLGL